MKFEWDYSRILTALIHKPSMCSRQQHGWTGQRLTWSSRVISVPRVLSVFHFSVRVRPCSNHLYLVSREPDTLLVSVLAEPVLLNSYQGERRVVKWKFCNAYTSIVFHVPDNELSFYSCIQYVQHNLLTNKKNKKNDVINRTYLDNTSEKYFSNL